jgi:chromosome segregation ATPase
MMIAVAATAVGPRLEKTMSQMEELSRDIAAISQQLDDPEMMENLKEAIESIQAVATNLESISDQFVGMDLRGQIEDLSEVVKNTGEALTGAADEIAKLNLAGLQEAIDNLKSFLAPLSALTSIGRE